MEAAQVGQPNRSNHEQQGQVLMAVSGTRRKFALARRTASWLGFVPR